MFRVASEESPSAEKPAPAKLSSEPEPSPAAAAAATPSVAEATSTAAPTVAFGEVDPDAKARRLARALVSDIATYHPERRDRSLQAGTLRREFQEEIKKSWDEYVSQVGMEIARRTPHFRHALNDILARGSRIF
ncbi:MAG TPA: hypothetical protein VFI91_03865 [Longimicrobiaceae bacterium]|nr:hypothetical protein [Longimicrobiaceae bacterium]